jgi:hypothetical protein
LPDLKASVTAKIKAVVEDLKFVNVSLDGWTDATLRSFNGYILQGIDSNWVLHTIPIAFEFVKGKFKKIKMIDFNQTKFKKKLFLGRHTGLNIKAQYDRVCEAFGIENKVYKIVADQGANVKCATKTTKEADDIISNFILIVIFFHN